MAGVEASIDAMDAKLTEHITIEPLGSGDFGQVAAWLSDRETNQWLSSDWRGRDVQPQIIAVLTRNQRNRLFLVRCGDEPSGFVALSEIDELDRTAMIWYVLGAKRLAGRGLMSRAVRAVTELAFRELNLLSVYAWAMENNASSRRLLMKCGYREAGCLRESAASSAGQVSRIYYDICPGDL
jgi:RimJ/RimL family protein N-acetyltransferase